jgi:ornithine carbamoyltransferase
LTAINGRSRRLDIVDAVKFSSPFLHHRRIWSIGDLPRHDVAAVLDTARALKRAEHSGLAAAMLRGKNIAVMDAPGASSGADSLERAASALGARVTHLQSTGMPDNGAAAATYRMLGRLYDAIDCVGMTPRQVERIEQEAGVPVFDGLWRPEHPARVIGELMEIEEHAHRPLEGLRLGFGGDLRAPRGRALARLAERTGMQVSAAVEPAPQTDFFIDGAEEGRWRCSGGGRAVDESESADDHRHVVQALLLMSLG